MQSRWWIWGVAGLLVVGLAAGGWAVSTRHQPAPPSAGAGAGASASPAGKLLGATTDLTVRVGAAERHYLMYVPAGYRQGQPAALVVAYHGEGSTAADFLTQTSLPAAADTYHFLLAVPQGWRPAPGQPASPTADPQSWNDGAGRTPAAKAKVDDAGFTLALLADVKRRYTVNAHRTYALGYASGGSLVLQLGLTQPASFAAVAAGAPNAFTPATLSPAGRVPFIVIQGGADPLVSKTTTGHTVNQLAQAFGCKTSVQTRTVVTGVTAATYPMCPVGMTASYIYVDAMGHTWAGGHGGLSNLVTGPDSPAVSATELAWQFLGSQQR